MSDAYMTLSWKRNDHQGISHARGRKQKETEWNEMDRLKIKKETD